MKSLLEERGKREVVKKGAVPKGPVPEGGDLRKETAGLKHRRGKRSAIRGYGGGSDVHANQTENRG